MIILPAIDALQNREPTIVGREHAPLLSVHRLARQGRSPPHAPVVAHHQRHTSAPHRGGQCSSPVTRTITSGRPFASVQQFAHSFVRMAIVGPSVSPLNLEKHSVVRFVERVGFGLRPRIENKELIEFSRPHNPQEPLESRGGDTYCVVPYTRGIWHNGWGGPSPPCHAPPRSS